VPDAWAELKGVASDRASGAAELTRRAAVALASLPPGRIPAACEVLLRGHPSMGSLWSLAAAVVAAADTDDEEAGADEWAGGHRRAAEAFAAALERDVAALVPAVAGRLGPELVTISWTSTVVAACCAAGSLRPTTAWCLRSEPGGEGARTARALVACGVAAEVVADDEGLRRAGSVDTVVVGADAVTPSGVVNKAGTRALAQAAQEAGVECLVLAGDAKFVGAEVPVVPPFEWTPLGLVTAVAAGERCLEPAEASARAAARPVPSVLTALLAELGGGPSPSEHPEEQPAEQARRMKGV
jgi:translation initiation factor 2B subunit (eIF-2B alpha/beta/delta family)